MRARTITIVIAVATAGVMALGAQPATALPKYDTKLSMGKNSGIVFGRVDSQLGKCKVRRRVVLFKQRPGADRRLLSTRTKGRGRHGEWKVRDGGVVRGGILPGDFLYAKVMPKSRNRYLCRADRSNWVLTWGV